MTTNEKALLLHKEWKRKPGTTSKAEVASRENLALAYTPGAAGPCRMIAADPEATYRYTIKSNTIAAVSDGSVAPGLDNIGPLAATPVMGGKAVPFREFGGVNAFPICLDTQDIQEITETIVRIASAFGGINLGDILAPRYFEIEEALKERLDIPMFHNDQHGTAIVVLAGVINTFRLTGRKKKDCRMAANGAGSVDIVTTKLLLAYGFSHVTMCDKSGILDKGAESLNQMQEEMMDVTNLEHRTGAPTDAMKGADIFVGMSAPGIVTQDMAASMNKDTILFAMANPVPEIMPDLAKTAKARMAGIDRSDFPNQVNNVVVFPGISKGVLEGRVSAITEEMKLVTAEAIAGLVDEKDLSDENIFPEAFDPRATDVVSSVVKDHIRR